MFSDFQDGGGLSAQHRHIVGFLVSHAFLEDIETARLTFPNPDLKIEKRNGVPAPGTYWEALYLAGSIFTEGTSIIGRSL